MQSLQTGIPTRYTDRMIGKLTTVLILCALCMAAAGQSLYRYRDANGNSVTNTSSAVQVTLH